MTALYRSTLLATVPIIGIAIGVSGCKPAASPGDVCSADLTYSTLTGLMAANVKQPQDAAIAPSALAAKMSQLVKFTLPTVDSIDQATKKVSCRAVMTVTSTPDAIKAARSRDVSREVMIAMLNGDQVSPDALEPPVPINSQAPDHISLQISYSVQPTADDKQTVVSLQQIETLGKIVFAAVDESNKPVSAAPAPSQQQPAAPASDTAPDNDAASNVQDSDPPAPNQLHVDPSTYGNIEVDKDDYQTAAGKLVHTGWHEVKPFGHGGDCSEVHAGGWDCAYYWSDGSKFAIVTIENGDVPNDEDNLKASVGSVTVVSQLPKKALFT